jgi:Vps51/Vps67
MTSSFPRPPPPGGGARRTSSGTLSSSSYAAGGGTGAASQSLPPPPNVQHHHSNARTNSISSTGSSSGDGSGGGGGSTNYAQTLARSMTIDEMRALHRKALKDAEAKETELRLVLASRYRELVGSSDEVTKMNERARELHDLVAALPGLMEKLVRQTTTTIEEEQKQQQLEEEGKASHEDEVDNDVDAGRKTDSANAQAVLELRQQLSNLPRQVHRGLDKGNVHGATTCLMELFRLIAQQTDAYPLATALAPHGSNDRLSSKVDSTDTLLEAQMRMTFLHVQTLPSKITKIAKHILLHSSGVKYAEGLSSVGETNRSGDKANVDVDPMYGAETSAAALSALDLLEIRLQGTAIDSNRSVELLDLYFDSKANLLQSLLNQLNTSTLGQQQESGGPDAGSGGKAKAMDGNSNDNAEMILSKIVLILQYDIVLHPYQIFILRDFPSQSKATTSSGIMKSLPMFPAPIVQAKVSKFLSAHLPLIRTKVKSVLVDIAGTTASALGKIRQSLYDKTDGVDCMERLNGNGVCTWDEAVSVIIDVPNVLAQSGISSHGSTSREGGKVRSSGDFSLWGVLFSNTFSSLVHSLLTTSFHSVHARVVSTLRLSLGNAPPVSAILPHEAYRNTLHIATELDSALLKVSDDAHELLVHAEERVESERRLRQSLYVQTCEIMGRLICELRRMLLVSDNFNDAVKQLIVGRLCHLLKFRLTALPTLLDPDSSPAVLQGSTGMISLMELSSAFELADDNDDGLITFQEAMEAVDSAFSGTQFHGADMVQETLLLAGGKDRSAAPASGNIFGTQTGGSSSQDVVTLNELTLLLARGIRHEQSGKHSALGTIQNSLDDIITTCMDRWATEVLNPSETKLSSSFQSFMAIACTCPEEEYRRLYASSDSLSAATPTSSSGPVVSNVSPHVVNFLLEISHTFNRSVCPSDSLIPVPSEEYALGMGIQGTDLSRMADLIRCALLSRGTEVAVNILQTHLQPALTGSGSHTMKSSGPSGIAQLKNDLSFFETCFFVRNRYGFGGRSNEESLKSDLHKIIKTTDILVRRACDMNTLREIESKQEHVIEVCDLFLSSLLGEDTSSSVKMGDLNDSSAMSRSSATPLYHAPITSSCRFPLLPIQADRTLSGVQARGKYKEKEENDSRSETVGGSAVRAGLGFFSSMLKKG